MTEEEALKMGNYNCQPLQNNPGPSAKKNRSCLEGWPDAAPGAEGPCVILWVTLAPLVEATGLAGQLQRWHQEM